MKKIRTITFSNAHNYGAMLQEYALQNILSNYSEDVEVIDYKDKVIGEQYNIIKKDKNLVKMILKNLFIIKNIKRYISFKKFEKNKIKLSKEKYYKESELIEKSPIADIYITGSDQVWNYNATEGLKDSYTLNFGANNIKRISYAASIGNSVVEKNMVKEYIDKISKLDYISVREENAQDFLNKIINKKVEVVLDPTLLLTKDEWNLEINNKEIKTKYILAYFVEEDKEFVRIVNELSKKTGLKVIHFAKLKRGLKNIIKSEYTKGPLEFIRLIRDAEYIICTSFHATVFSIIFNKKFFVIPHKKTGSRVTNLLDKLGIKNRVCYTLEEFEKIDYNFETDWDAVNKKLEEERKKSIKWLENAINN